jgi:hypothetical protein
VTEYFTVPPFKGAPFRSNKQLRPQLIEYIGISPSDFFGTKFALGHDVLSFPSALG